MPVEIDVRYVARLARLELGDDEVAILAPQLVQILEHAGRIAEVVTDDVPPTTSPLPRANIWRDDEPEPPLPVAEALRGAPDRDGDRFRVPRIVERG